MPLSTNTKAPVFVLNDVFDREIDLSKYAEKKILIAFFRHAGCPFCNLRVHTLMKLRSDLLAKNMEMIFFFESPQRVILRSTFHKEVSPVPIIADPGKIWYDKYGLEESLGKSVVSHMTTFVQTVIRAKKEKLPVHMMAAGESFSTMPAEFLVGEGLVIKDLHYSGSLNDRMDVTRILDFAKKGREI